MLLVKSKQDVPTEHHWAVICYSTDTHYVEGDERSRTNPGHGYPGGWESRNITQHYVSTNKEDWLKFVKKLVLQQKTNFIAFEVNHLISFDVKVFIK